MQQVQHRRAAPAAHRFARLPDALLGFWQNHLDARARAQRLAEKLHLQKCQNKTPLPAVCPFRINQYNYKLPTRHCQ